MLRRARSATLTALVVASLVSSGCEDEPAKCRPPEPSASAAGSSVGGGLVPSVATGGPTVPAAAASLVFEGGGGGARTLSLAELRAKIPAETVTQVDPYYNRTKTYRALPLTAVLELGFAGTSELRTRELVLRARDGYTVPMRGSKAFEPGAYLAFEDVEVPGWEPIGQQRANPGPLYLVWKGADQTDLETHPRPYQLATIALARFEDVFPRTVPAGVPEADPAWRGFALFREQCIHCHAINRQGGRVGPELNVPKSVVEYRPAEQIKAYIRDPLTFRYSTMPAHPAFGDAELDALVAYFSAMKDRKQDDPPAAPSASASAPALAPSASTAPQRKGPVTLPPAPGVGSLDTRR